VRLSHDLLKTHASFDDRPRARNPGQAAQQASGRTPTPATTPQNSPRRNQAGNELPELAGGSRISSAAAAA
jgi:hypothetical protein